MNATNTIAKERRHPFENKVPPPLVVVLIGVGVVAIAWFTPAIEIASTGRISIGSIAIALGGLMVVQGARTFEGLVAIVCLSIMTSRSQVVIGCVQGKIKGPI